VTGDVPQSAISAIVQTGIVGALLVVALWALWKFYQRIISNADEQRQRAERAEQEIRELNLYMRDKVLTTLADATGALRDVLSVLGRGDDR
jgi:hypothetical protein